MRDRLPAPHAWRTPGAGQLLWETCGDTYAVFNRVSGETHLLSELPAEVVRELDRSPRAIEELARTLAHSCGIEHSRTWQEKIASIVADLRQMEILSEDIDCGRQPTSG